MLNFKAREIFVFLFLVLLGLFAYRNCLNVFIPTDSYPLLHNFSEYGIAGMKSNFYDIGLYPVSNGFTFFLYKIFGLHYTAWTVFSVFIHAVNSFLLFRFGRKATELFSLKNGFLLSLFAAVIFLVSPFQTEVVLWAPREYNYLLATGFFILYLTFILKYFNEKKVKNLFLLHIFSLLAILSFEQTLIFPFIALCFFVFYRVAFSDSFSVKKFLTHIFLPQWVFIAFYFLTCKLWLGEWILHYGASTHLSLSLPLFIGNYVRYFAKFFLFYRYLPASRHELLHDVLYLDIKNNWVSAILFIAVAVIGCFLFIRFFRKEKKGITLLSFLFFGFLIALIPVINLDTSFVGAVISDRYGYFPALFFSTFLVIGSYILAKKIWLPITSGFVIISWICLAKTLPLWNEANDYSKRLIKNFASYVGEKNILILNMPDNLNWILTYRSGFPHALDFIYGVHPEITEIAGFYMTSAKDSVNVSVPEAGKILVESIPRKQSFIYGGVWAHSYETEHYSVEFNSDLSAYMLSFKGEKKTDGLKILYVAGDTWRELSETEK